MTATPVVSRFLPSPPPSFPWRAGNGFRLLVDGDAFFPPMLEAIESARRFVWMEIYLIESGTIAGRFIEALCRAAERGIEVRLLLDDFGSRGLQTEDRSRLQQAGIEIVRYNPLRYGARRRNFFRDHRKLLIVDGEIAFTGGMGITDDFLPEARAPLHWHDVAIEIRGPVLTDWMTLFLRNYRRWAATPLDAPSPLPSPSRQMENAPGRVNASPGGGRSPVLAAFVGHIQAADRRVWLATAYFAPTRKLKRALRRAALRGVEVRLLLPGPHSDHPWVRHIGRRHYSELLRDGVRIHEYQPRFLHSKLLICDDWVSIGSTNLDRWNFRWSQEANQEVAHRPFARRCRQLFLSDLAESIEITPESWYRRPRSQRLQEWFWGRLVTRVIAAIGRLPKR